MRIPHTYRVRPTRRLPEHVIRMYPPSVGVANGTMSIVIHDCGMRELGCGIRYAINHPSVAMMWDIRRWFVHRWRTDRYTPGA